MNIVSVNCSSCGAPIQVPPDIDQLTCSHCGTTLIVQRGEGYIALKVAEHISKAISEFGQQTREAISEGANLTQVELKRLQIIQDLSTTQMQLSSVQAEIRTLERQKENQTIKKQLKQLYSDETNLTQRIKSLNTAIAASAAVSSKPSTFQPRPTASQVNHPSATSKTPFLKTPFGKSCGSGCLVFFAIGVGCTFLAIPLDKAIFNIDSSTSSSAGPFSTIATFIALFCGLVAFFYKYYPDARIWRSIKEKLPGRKIKQSSQPNSESKSVPPSND